MLLASFPVSAGFLLVRSERAGDEFKITSTELGTAELEERIHTTWQNDLHHGLLTWNYGVGRNDEEAHVNLYRNRIKDIESMETAVSSGNSLSTPAERVLLQPVCGRNSRVIEDTNMDCI
jgi:hypothetical protein